MWLTMRSIRSAGLPAGAPLQDIGLASPMAALLLMSRWRKLAHLAVGGCTVSSTRSNTAKPTGLVSMRRQRRACGPWCPCCHRNIAALPSPAASRRNTSTS
jgi:hypothetical protein